MLQWERVPESRFDATSKTASMNGNYLRLPVYRIKQASESTAVDGKPVGLSASKTVAQLKTRLTSSVNFGNRESSQANWQLDDVYDPKTNGNFQKTEVNQNLDEWRNFTAGKQLAPSALSSINLT